MPIIKDKYGKGSQTRSKYLTRDINKAITTNAPTGLTTAQKNEISKEAYRSLPENITEGYLSPSYNRVNIFQPTVVDTVQEAFILQPGNSLNSLIISNVNGTAANQKIGLYVGYVNQSTFNFTLSSGVLISKGNEDGQLSAVFVQSIPYGVTIDLTDTVSGLFKNVNKILYFYTTVQNLGATITYNVTNG